MAIELSVFEDKKRGVFKVAVKHLSDQHLEPFKRFLGLDPSTTKARVRSGALASYVSKASAVAYASRLSNDQIMAKLTNGQTITAYLALDRPSSGTKVILNCQHFELLNSKGYRLAGSIYYQDLEALGRISGSEYRIRPTIVRQWTFDKAELPKILEKVHVVDKQVKGIKGMMLPVHQTRRTRVVSKETGAVADRHSAYARTTSPNWSR